MKRIYWFWHCRFPVTFHLEHDWHYEWTRFVGIRIGNWFIGAIHGNAK